MRIRASLLVPTGVILMSATGVGCSGCGDDSETTTSGVTSSSSSSSSSSSTTTTTSTGGSGGVGATGGTGGTGGVGGVGGGGAPNAVDTCPGVGAEVSTAAPLSLTGSTVRLANDYSSYCTNPGTGGAGGAANTTGPDAVYQVTIQETGVVTVSLEGTNGLDAVLYARSDCADDASVILCRNGTTDGTETFTQPANADDVWYIIVDGADASAGDYTLTVSETPVVCGDTFTQGTETCDDGNQNNGDGCDSTCQAEPIGVAETCPGEAHQVSLGVPLVISANTTNAVDDYLPPDTACPTAGGAPDLVYDIVPLSSGTLTATAVLVAGGFDRVLSAWIGTCSPAVSTMPPFLGCSDGPAAADPETLTFPVTANTHYYIVVDGYADVSAGAFDMTITLQ